MIVSELSTQVNDLLRPMGITRNLSAYSILCQCLELVCEQEDRLQAVEKDIYTAVQFIEMLYNALVRAV